MTLISLIFTLAIIGLILWAVNTYIPMDAGIKKILNVGTVIIVILWLVQVLGIFGNVANIRVGG